MSEFAPRLRLAALDGSDGFRISGSVERGYCGFSVSSAGDVNGDGFGDIAAGAEGAHPGGRVTAGETILLFGGPRGFASSIDAGALDGGAGLRFPGLTARDNCGSAVAGGDVDGDGFSDLLIGSPFGDPRGRPDAGECYVVFGRTGAWPANFGLARLDGANGFRIDGAQAGGRAGLSLATAGDVDGDGIGDMLIAAHTADPLGRTNAGECHVVYGSSGPRAASLDLAALDGLDGMRIAGARPGDVAGSAVACLGDVNGDGFGDLAIGAPGADPRGRDAAGLVHIVFGGPRGAASIDLASAGVTIAGVQAGGKAGSSVSAAGDVNADGYADIVIAAQGANAAYLVFGGKSFGASPLALDALDGANGFRMTGGGTSAAGAGDVNGDGFADIVIGAEAAGIGGRAYVVFGRSGGFAPSLSLVSLDGDDGFRIEPEAAGDRLGFSAAAVGDVDGDGFGDIVLGAVAADAEGRSNAGASYVVFGHRALDAVTRTGTAIANTINGGQGGDAIDGRGGNDSLLGWEGNDLLRGDAGRDILAGGEGRDRFDFDAISESGTSLATRDTIVDFAAGPGFIDRLDLRGIDAMESLAGNQAFAFIGTAAFDAEGQVRAAQSGPHTVVEINVSGTAGAEMAILLRKVDAPDFGPADFLL